jgi:signal transduction histidine kinase
MRILTALKLTSAISIVMMVGSVVGSALSFTWLREASAFEVLLIDLQADVFERTQLRDDFLLLGRREAFLRWQLKSAETGRHLQHLSEKPLPVSGAAMLERMNRKFMATMVLVPRIAEVRASAVGNEAARKETRAIEQRLTNQVLVESYLLSDSTKLLLLEARGNTIHARNRLLLLLVLATLALGLTVTSATVYLSRLMARRVSALAEGTDNLANGRFEHRIPADGDDELANLSRGVNDMAGRLQHSYGLLETTNRELEAFSYSVSHDLRAPLRHLTGFVELLDRKDTSGLDEKSRHYLEVISSSAKKMGCLIDDLLSFSRMGRSELMTRSVDLQQLAQEVIEEVSKEVPPGRVIQWRIAELPVAPGDRAMLRLALVNLIGNAVKFSHRVEAPVIEVGTLPPEKGCHILFVRDNGAGFNMKYVDKLFGLFQRLHPVDEYDGTGVGLANVRRIITRHGGNTWAEGELDKGATFYFTLPIGKEVLS